MLEFLKKIGIPATAAAVITAIVTIVPFLWKIDERYAKQEQLEEVVKKLEAENHELSKELAQSVGFQQAMLALIQQGKVPVQQPQPVLITKPIEIPSADLPATASRGPASASPKSIPSMVEPQLPQAEVKPKNWNEIGVELGKQQERLQQRK